MSSSHDRLQLLQPGHILDGKYVVEAALGAGAMGTVYRVRQMSLDRGVALKALRPGSEQALGNLRRFAREARLLTRLSHPNLVTVYDAELESEPPYIAMRLVEGPSLELSLSGKSAGPPLDPLAVARGLLDGLAYCHEQGVLHRDIKPANILLEAGTHPLFVDFGLAHHVGSSALTSAGYVVGTPAYLAPEQLSAGVFNVRTDLYQLGLVLYEVAAGKLVFGDATQDYRSILAMRLEGRVPPLVSIAPATPKALAHVVERCLVRNPDGRPESVRELLAMLGPEEPAPAGISTRRSAVRPGAAKTSSSTRPAVEAARGKAEKGIPDAAAGVGRPAGRRLG